MRGGGWMIESRAGYFLRQHNDGALSWTANPLHALAYATEDEALAVVRKHLSGEVHAHWVTRTVH